MFDIGAELIAKWTGGHRKGNLDAYGSVVDLDVADHSQLDDVGTELWVDDTLERGPDILQSRPCGCARRPGWCDRRLARCVHGMIDTTGAVAGGSQLLRPGIGQEGDAQ